LSQSFIPKRISNHYQRYYEYVIHSINTNCHGSIILILTNQVNYNTELNVLNFQHDYMLCLKHKKMAGEENIPQLQTMELILTADQAKVVCKESLEE